MQPTLHEIEAKRILAAEQRRKRAKEILSAPASPGALVIGLIVGAVAGLVSYILQDSSIPSNLSALLVGISCSLSAIGVEQWSIRRRLEAAIELLKLESTDGR